MMQPRRTLHELIDSTDSAWPIVQDWIAASAVPVEVLQPDVSGRDELLLEAQMPTHSPLGAILYETGGLLIDRGWLRILGSGHAKFRRSFSDWNRPRAFSETGQPLGYVFVADDVVGGFFALDDGGLGPGKGHLYYYAPDTLRWESMNEFGFSQFLLWALSPKLAEFYRDLRWPGWEIEVAKISADKSLSLIPPLWTREGKDIANASRCPCDVAEIWSLNLVHVPKQLSVASENS